MFYLLNTQIRDFIALQIVLRDVIVSSNYDHVRAVFDKKIAEQNSKHEKMYLK